MSTTGEFHWPSLGPSSSHVPPVGAVQVVERSFAGRAGGPSGGGRALPPQVCDTPPVPCDSGLLHRSSNERGSAQMVTSSARRKPSPRSRLDVVGDDYGELRSAVRPYIAYDGEEFSFEPSSYVINGPGDQIPLFDQLYELQTSAEHATNAYEWARRLAAVAWIDGLDVQPMQHRLEQPSRKRKSWDSNYGSHGWHRYIGRFPPHIVRSLLNHFGANRGDVICDPFLGSGTTLVEARLLGMEAVGVEICPLSAMISRTKALFPREIDELEELAARFDAFYEDHWTSSIEGALEELSHRDVLGRPGNAIEPFVNIENWFTPQALLGTSIAVEFGATLDGYARDFFCTALSAKMRSIGNLDVDVVRAEYRHEPRTSVDVHKLVSRQLRRMIRDIKASIRSHGELLSEPKGIDVIEGDVFQADIPDGSIDYIITSPPYGVETVSYLRTHLLSYRSLHEILGRDPYEYDERIVGSEYIGKPQELEHAPFMEVSPVGLDFFARLIDDEPDARTFMMIHFFDDMDRFASKSVEWLKPGGRMAFVIGNKRLGRDIIPTDEIIAEVFQARGLSLDRTIKHKLKTNNSNSQVPWQERTVQDEYIMLYTKV